MNLELRSIVGNGEISRERLTFRANNNLDVGDYVVLQSGYIDGEITTDVHNSFWFTYKAINKGDLVVLYTRAGRQSSKPLKERGIAHFFYWGLSSPIWDDEDKAAVVLLAPEWQGRSSSELSER